MAWKDTGRPVIFCGSRRGNRSTRVQFERFFKGDASDLIGDSANAPGRDAAALGHGFGRVFVASGNALPSGGTRAVRDRLRCARWRTRSGLTPGVSNGGRLAGDAIDDQFFAVLIAHQKTELGGAFIAVHQDRGRRCIGPDSSGRSCPPSSGNAPSTG